MTLNNLSVGKKAKIEKINVVGPLKRRIQEMGITKGADIFVRKLAPLGDPMEVSVRGYELSLRKDDAKFIEVISG
jgi:ferrous iron transport protein A